MAQKSPVILNGVIDLQTLSLDPQSFRFGSLTMESDKYISVKDQAKDGSLHVVVVDMHSNNSVTKKPMKAEATLMNTVDNIIALKGKTEGQNGHFIQVFNLDTKDKLGVHQFAENVVFWRWVGPRSLAVVAETAVYHWNLDSTSSVPSKMFDRAGKLADASTQIISYAVNREASWCLLTGISTPDGGKTIEGSMQLFSVDKQQQQLLEGHAGTFGEIPIDDSGKSIGLFCFMERKHGTSATRLHILDLSRSSSYKVTVDVHMPADAPNDFAVAMHLSDKHGVVYAVTKAGTGFIFDTQTGALLYQGKVSGESVFIGCGSDRTGGMLFVNRRGQVFSFQINEAGFVEYINTVLVHLPNRGEIGMNLGRRFALPGVDYSAVLRSMVVSNPEGAAKFAISILTKNPPLMDPQVVIDMFLSLHKMAETSSILLEILKPNRQDQARLQTKLFEINLIHNPQVAEAIFQMKMLTHYDRALVAGLCEKAGMYQRALEHYTEPADIKRCMLHSHTMAPDFLTDFIGKLVSGGADSAIEIMTDMMRYNRQQNMQIVVQTCIKYYEQFGFDKVCQLFEAFQCYDGLFFFLGGILAASQDPEVHFKYIEAASRLGHVQEVERVCKESKYYDPIRVKDFLKGAKLPDPRPLIYVCDLHGFIEELTSYLYKNNLMKYVEVYVVKVNPANCPRVIGALIDLDCPEEMIKGLLTNVRTACPVGPLVEEVEKRNRTKIIQPWLEARVAEGSTDVALHNAIAKVTIDMNKDPENFLKTNAFYDSVVVGKYCEQRDPNLAFICYKRAWGKCDNELIDVTNKNGMYRLQARYLVERQSAELWAQVLTVTNEHRKHIIDQVVATALPETTDQFQVSAAVKAFMDADLPHELIELLDKIVLRNGQFGDNKNLQNLLIVTAIRADPSRVMDYVNRLGNFDGAEIAKVALGHNLFEEAFQIYKKFNLNNEAMDTLLTNLSNVDRANEFAARINDPNVWYKLGRAQLDANMVPEAMQSYLKAEDPRDFIQVVEAAEREEFFDELIVYLKMARTKMKEAYIDTELLYSLAKKSGLAELDEFLATPNLANIQSVGDRLFDERLFKCAKLLFASIPNNSRLASCFVALGEFQAAIEAAKKANNTRTWKEITAACVAVQEFRVAQLAGQFVMQQPDHLDDLIQIYEKNEYHNELIALLESGLGDAKMSHVGMLTELGVLYAKYKAPKLGEYVKANAGKLNIPKVIRACEANLLWKEAVFLYISYDEADSAANLMMAHSPTAWTHDEFVSIAKKIANTEIYYRAIQFYLEEHPLLLNSFLIAVAPKLDHSRVINILRKDAHLPLVVEYLQAVQSVNVSAVNDALNELLLEEEDVGALKLSVANYDQFDQLGLAAKLEKHELKEMRRLAAVIYAKNKKYNKSVELSKSDASFQDAIQAARESQSHEFSENLLRFFVESGNKECFAATLYACYDYLRPDVVMELGWRNGLMDYCMPYMIQVMREYHTKIDALDKKATEKEERKKNSKETHQPEFQGSFGNNLALMPPGSFPAPQASFGGYQSAIPHPF